MQKRALHTWHTLDLTIFLYYFEHLKTPITDTVCSWTTLLRSTFLTIIVIITEISPEGWTRWRWSLATERAESVAWHSTNCSIVRLVDGSWITARKEVVASQRQICLKGWKNPGDVVGSRHDPDISNWFEKMASSARGTRGSIYKWATHACAATGNTLPMLIHSILGIKGCDLVFNALGPQPWRPV